MAAQLQRGDTFVDGQTVTGDRLNNLVDLAIAKPGIITEPPLKTYAEPEDGLLLWDHDTTALARTPVGTLPLATVGLAMPTAEFDVTGNPVAPLTTLTASWKNQTRQKFLASPVSGTGLPSFREITAPDVVLDTYNIPAANIDWSLGYVFLKGLTLDIPLSMDGTSEGQTILVFIYQTYPGNFTVTWPPGIRWANSSVPVQSTGNGVTDIYQFWCVAGVIFGNRIAAACL